MAENRNFKGVWIPKEIWNNKELTWMEKLLLVEIDSLDNEHGCYSGNEYFAKFFDLSQDRISKLVTSLRKKEYITVELQRKGLDKTKRIIKVDQFKFKGVDSNRQKQREPLGENAEWSLGENAEYNNTSINNTNNIKDMVDSKESTEHSNLDIQFDEWWNIYGKKKQKPKAFTAFKKVVKKYGYDELKANTEFFVKNHVKDKQYQPYPSTFLNNYHPDDEDFKNIGNQPNKNNYNNYNTNATPTTTVYKPVNDDLYGDVEI